MTDFMLTRRERAKLHDLIAHPHDAQPTLRAYALLWLDDGESVSDVAHRLGVTRQTVYNWASRFQARTDLQIAVRLADAPRSGRPCTAAGVIDPLIEAVIKRDPRSVGLSLDGLDGPAAGRVSARCTPTGGLFGQRPRSHRAVANAVETSTSPTGPAPGDVAAS